MLKLGKFLSRSMLQGQGMLFPSTLVAMFRSLFLFWILFEYVFIKMQKWRVMGVSVIVHFNISSSVAIHMQRKYIVFGFFFSFFLFCFLFLIIVCLVHSV